jgi:hypothetical protein
MNIRNADFPARRPSVWLIAGCLAAVLASGQAQAYGRDTEGSSTAPKPNCPKGQVYDSRTQSCVNQQSSLTPAADHSDHAQKIIF